MLRLRTVVRGERASRSIVNRTTASWSIWMVSSLIVAGLALELFSIETYASRRRTTPTSAWFFVQTGTFDETSPRDKLAHRKVGLMRSCTWARTSGRAAPSIVGSRSNVVHSQAGWLARPRTKSPETRIYFTTRRSGAFPVPRVRTVVRGERASQSIVNRTTALWSIWMVPSLILAGV